MTSLDIFVLVLLGGGALVGFARGFVHEVLALAAWIAGIAAVKTFHDPLALRLEPHVGSPSGASAAAFVVTFLGAYLLMRLLARSLGGRTRKSVIGPVDRVLGAGFGMLKGLIGATLVFLLANFATDLTYGADAERPAWMAHARSFKLMNASGKALVGWVKTRRGMHAAVPGGAAADAGLSRSADALDAANGDPSSTPADGDSTVTRAPR